MFKNREISVKWNKPTKDQTNEVEDPEKFKKNAEVILQKLERLGTKMFVGLCIYVVIDTYRQKTVAEASNPKY